jgi:hypothetical protein
MRALTALRDIHPIVSNFAQTPSLILGNVPLPAGSKTWSVVRMKEPNRLPIWDKVEKARQEVEQVSEKLQHEQLDESQRRSSALYPERATYARRA